MKTTRDNETTSIEPVDAKELFAQFFGTHQEFVTKYSHCPMCGSNLHFHYLTDFAHNRTQETARCLECAIKIRRVNHGLQ